MCHWTWHFTHFKDKSDALTDIRKMKHMSKHNITFMQCDLEERLSRQKYFRRQIELSKAEVFELFQKEKSGQCKYSLEDSIQGHMNNIANNEQCLSEWDPILKAAVDVYNSKKLTGALDASLVEDLF
jgi:uncharacterized protein YlaN (UPF0358 family)